MAPSHPPNIVLIVADDLGFSDLGSYGGEIPTPHLNRMGHEGVQFTQFYNCAVCVATRAALMTGLHPRFGAAERIRPGMSTLAETLHDAGYRTAMAGKWHLGSRAPSRPIDRGFQEFYGFMGGSCNYFDPRRPAPGQPKGGVPIFRNSTAISQYGTGYYTTDAFTDFAIEQIRSASAAAKPLFLHLAYNAPHFPLQAPAADIARHRGRYDAGYLALRQSRHARQRRLGLFGREWAAPRPDQRLGPFRYDYQIPEWNEVTDRSHSARMMEIYAAMVERMDHNIGRVMKTLKECGADQNTLVLFFSDNGGCASIPTPEEMPVYDGHNRGKVSGTADSYLFCGPGWSVAQNTPFRRYKTWTYEGGISTPFIARWPAKIRPKRWNHQATHVVDILPTLAELTGAKYAGEIPLEGRSLTRMLLDPNHTMPAGEMGWFLYGSRAYREGKWKIVWGPTAGRWELYDMEEDRTETRELSRDQPELVSRLTKRWMDWAKNTGAPTTFTSKDWSVF